MEIDVNEANGNSMSQRNGRLGSEELSQICIEKNKQLEINGHLDNPILNKDSNLIKSIEGKSKIISSLTNSSKKVRKLNDFSGVISDNKNSDNINSSINKNTLNTSLILFSVFMVLFVLFFCIIPLKKISYAVPIVYQDVEKYIEQVPFVETVYYTEKEPYVVSQAYTVREPYVITVPYVIYPPDPDSRPRFEPSPISPPTLPIPTHRTEPPPSISKSKYPIVHYSQVIRYVDVVKYRDVINYKDVTKSRQEIRYKPIEKQRIVTKVKQETRYKIVPLLYYLVNY